MKNFYLSLTHDLLSALKHFLLPIRLRLALRDRPSPVLVEVGANDGRTGDPLYHLIRNSRHGQALLIEPVPYLFDRLRITYSGLPHCILANVSIAPTAGTMPIYCAIRIENRPPLCWPTMAIKLKNGARISSVAGSAPDR